MAPTQETVLAALPRVVRIADETRWRGQAALGTALVVIIFWSLTWVLGQEVEPVRTPVGLAAVALPTLIVAGLASARRVQTTLAAALPPPRSVVHETAAAARDRRMRLANVVLVGIVVLLLFDRFTGGGGMMAGLVAGLMGAMGAVDLRESRLWRAAERERSARLFVLVRPRALTPALAPSDIYEAPDGAAGGPLEMPADPRDLP